MIFNGHRILALTLTASIALLLCCGSRSRQINVLLIGIDTLRPDHLGCYGYHRDTSPAIDDLAKQGVLFKNTISQSPWTLPSFATVFTSLYPSQHGAMTTVTSIRSTIPTLATILKERGYATGAVINAAVLRSEFGLNRGFDFYDPTPPEGRLADGTTVKTLEWVDAHKGSPFFMFAHYFDPHEPYAPPPPFDTLFTGAYRGRIGNSFVLHDHFPNVKGTHFDDMRSLTSDDWDRIQALYDGEIAFADRAVGQLLKGLDDRGLRRNTLVIFLSDHGEEFFEHEGFGHGHALYGEVIRVPLIFVLPEEIPQGVAFDRQVRLADVMPTILDLMSITPDIHMEGTSLAPLITGKGSIARADGTLFPTEIAYSEGLLRGSERKAVTAHPWKLVYDLSTTAEKLYNLEEDPGEYANLMVDRPDALPLLQDMIYGALFSLSDTWYVEMAGTRQGQTFDIRISVEKEPSIGHIPLYRFLDESGHIVDLDLATLSTTGAGLSIEGLRLHEPLTLAFKAEAPPRVPVTFDIRIDGEPDLERTYVGEALANPHEMPFARTAARRAARSVAEPSRRPSPPYCLIWHSRSAYTGKTTAQIDPATRRELKALGYIQ
jgi:arylsulfatase A-like enzyme